MTRVECRCGWQGVLEDCRPFPVFTAAKCPVCANAVLAVLLRKLVSRLPFRTEGRKQ